MRTLAYFSGLIWGDDRFPWTYPIRMRKPNQKYVGADIPSELWEKYEQWAAGRPKIDKRQLVTAMFRLFLAAPESLKMITLYGKSGPESDRILADGLREIVAEIVRAERKRK